MGEKVLFLDRTLLPSKNINKVRVSSSEFCGHLWKDDFLQINDTNVKDALRTFYRDALPASFGEFIEAVLEYTLSSGERIWIVVDEVVLLENFPIDLPEEQAMGPFNWIVTGSAGIGSWVAKKHLAKFVFDLPLFSKDESFKFAFDLSRLLGVNLQNGIAGVPFEGVDDWLEERFGGVVGYITEMLLDISKGNSVSQYMSSLSKRVKSLIVKSAGGTAFAKQTSQEWLNQIKSPNVKSVFIDTSRT